VASQIFSAIFAHHAAAVAKEQGTLCAAVPAANQALQVIDEAVQSGQATPQQAIDALNAMPGQFRSQVSGIYQDCNAACVMYEELEAICLVKASQYQDLIDSANATAAAASAQPTQIVTPSRPNTTAPAAAAPASSYAPFYSPTSSTAAQTQTPGAAPGVTGDWLPIAALFIAGFLLLRSV
jgi:hypothetical protein